MSGLGLDWSAGCRNVMEYAVLDLFWFERRGEDIGEAVQELVAGIIHFVDEGDGS